jgi:replicative DNA helicase
METNMTSRVTPLREPSPELLLRVPPYNPEAETSLLGALLINNSIYHRVSEFLQGDHFGNALHGRIFAAIGKLIERGQIANPITLKNMFDQDAALTEVGGAQYLVRLAQAAVAIIDAQDYARAVHDLHLRRELITLGEDVVNDAFRHDLDDPAREQIERAEKKLFDLATTGQAEGGFRVLAAA